MGLVDYSDSESDTEVVAKSAPSAHQPATGGIKKPSFQKVVDRSKPGKILVNLPGSSLGQDHSNTTTDSNEPPAKRARTSKGGAFSGFNSFLPAPKNVGKKPAASNTSNSDGSSAKGTNAPRPGVHLKTGAAPGFSRNTDEYSGDGSEEADASVAGGGAMSLPAPKSQQPMIPAGQKPAEEVELVGKPLMFRPLSVSRKKPTKKTAATASSATAPKSAATVPSPTTTVQATIAKPDAPAKKKISLFSISDEPPEDPSPQHNSNGVYEPLIDIDNDVSNNPTTLDAFAAYDAQYSSSYSAAPPPQSIATVSSAYGASNSLDSIASSMNLSAAARRELFGRGGMATATAGAAKVINFDTEREYAHNEELRASGEQQTHNPLRGIAPGKHSLRQLVNQVQNQRDALEESFAQGKAKQGEAGARYGWR